MVVKVEQNVIMSSVQQPSNFVFNIIHPLFQSFLEKTSAEQWKSFLTSSPDDATKVLVAELILEIIAGLSNLIFIAMKSPSTKTEEHLLSELESSLLQTFSEALGIPNEVDNLRLKTLTNIINEEVKYNLRSGGKAGITKHLTPVARLNAMTDQLTHLFHKFSDKIKMFFAPLLCKSRGHASAPRHFATKVSITSPTSEVIKHEINNELSAIINPLLLDIPHSEDLQEQLSREIQEVADEVVCTFYVMRSKKSSAFKALKERMKSFVTKCFAKVCLMRILSHLKKKYSQDTLAISESAEEILMGLTSQFVDHIKDTESEDSFLLVFKNLCADKVLDFSQELNNLIYHHALPEPLPHSGDSSGHSQSKVRTDVWSKTWIFMVLMNWFLTTRINSMTDQLTLPLMDKSLVRMNEYSKTSISALDKVFKEEQRSKKNKKYIQFVIEKVVYTVCSDANMVLETRDEIITNLTKTIWNNVQDEQFHIHAELLKNIERNIRKSLYRNMSSPENVLFLISHEDPDIIDRIKLVIDKKLLWPPKSKNTLNIFDLSAAQSARSSKEMPINY